jgi:hypothetical protein
MLKEELANNIKTMQAALEGKKIQWRPHGLENWEDVETSRMIWNFPSIEYRIKPEEPDFGKQLPEPGDRLLVEHAATKFCHKDQMDV